MTVEFATFTAAEAQAVERIVARTEAMFARYGREVNLTHVRMDLAAVHAKLPLHLAALAEAPDFDFAHDITGIMLHLNRQTGDLEDHFLPRFCLH